MALDAEAPNRLRRAHYNSTLIERIEVHDELIRIRVQPDAAIPPFSPGQYVALGLGNWEPRIEPSQPEDLPEKKWNKISRRAYSISCPMIDPTDPGGRDGAMASEPISRLLPCDQLDYLEFYITLVRFNATDDGPPPAFTPRLFLLRPGDRLVMESKITGKYTLAGIETDDTVLMLGTGTGEAPHNAMVASLLARGHRGNVINVTTVRSRADLGYASEHRILMDLFPQYRYLAFTTREPENLEPTHPGYVGKQYLQTLFASGELARLADDPLDPARTHVFLCGNPAMIGYVPPGAEPPAQVGMLSLLRAAGFIQPDARQSPTRGHIRFEKYW